MCLDCLSLYFVKIFLLSHDVIFLSPCISTNDHVQLDFAAIMEKKPIYSLIRTVNGLW